MIGVCGGAKPYPAEELAMFMSCKPIIGVNHHRPFPNVAPDYIVGNIGSFSMQEIQKMEPTGVEQVQHHVSKVKIDTFNPQAGLRAIGWTLQEWPDEQIYVGGMDMY